MVTGNLIREIPFHLTVQKVEYILSAHFLFKLKFL